MLILTSIISLLFAYISFHDKNWPRMLESVLLTDEDVKIIYMIDSVFLFSKLILLHLLMIAPFLNAALRNLHHIEEF